MEGAPSGFYARTVLLFDIVRTMQEQKTLSRRGIRLHTGQ